MTHDIRQWIDLVEARRPKQPIDPEQAKWEAEDAALNAEFAKKAKYKGPFKELERAAEAEDFYPATAALSDAESNAAETEGIEYDSAAYWETALGSISFTSPFTEEPKVRQWFEAHGYQW